MGDFFITMQSIMFYVDFGIKRRVKLNILPYTIEPMTPEQIAVLAQKVKEGTSTQEEELALLKFLNKGVDEMKVFIKEVTKEEN